MKLKLKEDPREWQKFTSVMMALGIVVSGILWKRGVVPLEAFWVVVGVGGVVAVIAWLWARPFRGFYRVGMTVSFRVGQVMGGMMLTVFFLIVITPLGLMLRMAGKDLLKLRRDPGATSYWTTPRGKGDLDRQF